jgi:hypothetical protein
VEVGRVVVHKWKSFFEDLELHHDLFVDSETHIWLVHHLFLDTLNSELEGWTRHWNAHIMQLRYEPNKCPREMFTDGILQCQAPGIHEWIEAHEENVPDIQNYGVDLEGMSDAMLIEHLREREPNAFADHAPAHFNEVACEPPVCPLTPASVRDLDATLAREFDPSAQNMELRKMKWDRALEICSRD